MDFRPALPADLPALEALYREITHSMAAEGTVIWDERYPRCALPGDIAAGNLYVLLDGPTPVSAFALWDVHDWAGDVPWLLDVPRACYLSRLGVKPGWLRRGVGAFMMEQGEALARQRGAQALRVFVVDFNTRARRLYERLGFRWTGGSYPQRMDHFDLTELPYEKEITP